MLEATLSYLKEFQGALSLLCVDDLLAGYQLLSDARRTRRTVYLLGNGGSAATASHLAVDLGRNVSRASGPPMRVICLTDNVPWLTAVANDDEFAGCFDEPLSQHVQRGDVVVALSASGDSENVVRAFESAKRAGARRLALVGFDGGRLAPLADERVWIRSHDYGVVETLHVLAAHVWVRLLNEESGRQERGPRRQAEASEAFAVSR